MARQKELGPKSLQTLLKTTGQKQTPAEQHQVMRQIAAAYGLTMRFEPKVA